MAGLSPELVIAKSPTGSNDPKPFLRRGSGLARYGGVGGPPKRFSPNPTLRRSESHRGSKTSLSNDNDKQLKTSKSCPNVTDQQQPQQQRPPQPSKRPIMKKSTLPPYHGKVNLTPFIV